MKVQFDCCYKCKDRHVGCHSECDKYKELKDKVEEEKKNIRDRKKVDHMMYSVLHRKKRR